MWQSRYYDGPLDAREGTNMDVRLLVHMEALRDDHRVVWWIESPDIPELTATAPSLGETRVRAEIACREILAEREVDDVRFSYSLLEPDASEGLEVVRTGAAQDAHQDFDREVNAKRVTAAVA